MKNKESQWALYALTAILTVVVVMLFSSTTSPLYPNSYGVDSAFNRFMGLMIRRGKTLYSEIWDNKGPVLFFLQAIGTLKGTHNGDVSLTFLMQILSLFLSIFFLYKAESEADHRQKSLKLLLPVICGAAVFSKVIEGGNLSEEWSLPMISCSLFLMVKYAANITDEPLHPRLYAFIQGICFALIAFIRVNNAVSICAGLAAIAIYLIYRKKWQNLLENILFGLLGFAAIAIPICLYFWMKHALGDMIYGVFLYNLKYAAQRTHKTFTGTDLFDRFLPIAASFVILLAALIRNRGMRLLDWMLLLIVMVNGIMLWSSNIFLHYYIIFVPILMLILLIYVKFPRIPEILASLMVFAFFLSEDIPLLSGLPHAKEEPDRFVYAAAIPDDEKDPAMVLYASPAVYLNSGLIPCSRFAAYHFAHFPVDPSMREEFLNDMRNNQPVWIIYLSGYEGVIPEVQAMLNEEYDKVHTEYDLAYYRIRGHQTNEPEK